jgi:hypothetical protein
MDVEIEKPHVPHKSIGQRWHDIALPLAALFVSFVSIYIAWHHSQIMRELVHQNERIVQAESLPYLQIETSNLESDLRTPALRLSVEDQGVGPARIAQVAMTVNGQQVPDFNTLVDHCCAPGLLQAAKVGTKQFRGIRNGEVILSKLQDRMIRPGESVDAFVWPTTAANAQVIDKLQRGLMGSQVNISICYCSVFDECWVRTDDDRRPMPVKSCPIPRVAYRQ